MSRTEEVVRSPAGRELAVTTSGPDDGWPVFLLHGMPGSRIGPLPRSTVLNRMGVRLISYDRPGYGNSERCKGRSVADAAYDVECIADFLHIDRFAVVGRSGGGPHALACAALLPQRVTRTAVLAGFAPPDAAGLDWFAGMANGNVAVFEHAHLVEFYITKRADEIRKDPDALMRMLEPALESTDRRVVEDPAMRKLITDSCREAVKNGPYGWVDDIYALRRDWGFPVGASTSTVMLWHGAEDTIAPTSHAEWLAKQIGHARLSVAPKAGHFAAVEILPKMLPRLIENAALV